MVWRFISSVLAILVLVLSFFPCNDAEAAVPLHHSAAAQGKEPAADHNHPAHQADLCSPFCICACCTGITLPVTVSFQVATPAPAGPQVLASYIPQAISSLALPVWQPPQLV